MSPLCREPRLCVNIFLKILICQQESPVLHKRLPYSGNLPLHRTAGRYRNSAYCRLFVSLAGITKESTFRSGLTDKDLRHCIAADGIHGRLASCKGSTGIIVAVCKRILRHSYCSRDQIPLRQFPVFCRKM